MKRYWRFLLPAGAIVAVLVFLLVTLSGSLVYFKTPTEITTEQTNPAARLRLGGQVAAGSVADTVNGVTTFAVTDGRMTIDVVHQGAPQTLFREGIGVVLEGNWDGVVFHSDTMLVQHDEQYRTEEEEYHPPGDTAVDS